MATWGVTPADPAGTVLDDLLLITSELVTNASKVCAGEIRLTVTAHRNRIRVGVADDNPTPAGLVGFTDDSVGGRGLALVAALCSRWGQQPWDGRQKLVWCEIALPEGSVLARGCDE